jgi:glycosyltransferase involved in cell wall biosynthesis
MNKVKKGILIFPLFKDLNPSNGIISKNEGIKNGFFSNGIEVDVLEFNSTGIFTKDAQIFNYHPNRYRRILQHNYHIWKNILDIIQRSTYEFVWLRASILTSAIADFLGQIKAKCPSCKIILEYGAYPFVKELTALKQAIYYLNIRNERRAHRFSDFIISYSGQEYIDDRINIPINNGVDVESIPFAANTEPISSTINFISVSSLRKWHAYERFIEGMAIFKQGKHEQLVNFHIVGNGPEYDKLVQATKKLGLEDDVIFHGFKSGTQLDNIFQRSHVAIGTLGFHRIGLNNSSSLKNREYFARGLPLVLSTFDKDMPASLPFVKYIPEGEEPVNIADIVAFSRNVYLIPDVNQTIRDYAHENLSWKSKIKTVLEYLNGKAVDKIDRVGSQIYS